MGEQYTRVVLFKTHYLVCKLFVTMKKLLDLLRFELLQEEEAEEIVPAEEVENPEEEAGEPEEVAD